jgi:glycosyltransferase involved in cell wall biosynthesis
MSQFRRRAIFLGMYPMGRIDRARAVRLHYMHQALSQLAEVDFIFGNRRERQQHIHRYLKSEKVKGADGLYVETSTSWCTLADLQLMVACRRSGVPVVTWIPDAYPLFPETMAAIPFHKRLGSSLLWRLSVRGYFRTTDVICTQSEGFSRLFNYPPGVRSVILPPAADPVEVPPISTGANTLLYTGNASQPRFGVEMLVEALEIARRELPDLRLLLVCPPDGHPPKTLYNHRAWIEVMSLATDEIVNVLAGVRILVNPLRDVPYHRLQIPVKVMSYLGYGRPILSTDLPEISRIIQDTGAGLVVPATVQGLAGGVRRLFSADQDELNRMGQNALRAVREKHSWRHRAQQILDAFEEARRSR